MTDKERERFERIKMMIAMSKKDPKDWDADEKAVFEDAKEKHINK